MDTTCSVADSTLEANAIVNDFDRQVTVDEARALFHASRLHYGLIQELLWDMAYDAELGFLSPGDEELYDTLSCAWMIAHLNLREISAKPLSNVQADSFLSRIEDKLDQRLELLPEYLKDNPDHYMIDRLLIRKMEAVAKLHDIRTHFIETISSILSTTSRLFSGNRAKFQSKMNLHVAATLEDEAKYLSAQSQHLTYTIQHELRKPSTTLNNLQRTKSELEAELRKTHSEVDRMKELLSAYEAQDAKYHDLVKRYKDCQNQLAVYNELLTERDARPKDPRNIRSDRRSFSLSALPKTNRS